MKKILCFLISFAIVFPGSMLHAASSDGGKQVKVIMKDGSIVTGELLGIDDGSLMLQTKSGKSKEIAVSKIKKVFDADGNSVSLGKSSAPAKSSSSSNGELSPDSPPGGDDDEEEAAPRRSRTRAREREREPRRGSNGGQIAGIILDIVGGVGFVAGLYFNVDGQSRMDNATSKYCPAKVCTDGYYDYKITGKPGYYTSTQYYEYYSGESERNIGTGVMVVGGALLITGIIVGAVSSGKNREDAGLINFDGSKVAWSLPKMDYNPNTEKSKLTLLTAQF